MTVIATRIQASGHDGYFGGAGATESTGTNFPYNTTTVNGKINAGTAWNTGYYIFSGVLMNQGDTVNSASLTMTYGASLIGVDALLRIAVGDVDSATIPTSAAGVSGLAKTGYVYWNVPNGVTTVDTQITSPSIKNLIQSVVNRPGWQINNNIGIYLTASGTNTSNEVTFYAWDYTKSSTSGQTPTLNLNFDGTGVGASGQLFTLTISGESRPNNNLPLYIGNSCLDILRPSGDYLLDGSGKFTNSAGTTTSLWSYVDESVTDSSDTNYLQITQSGATNKPQYLYYIGTDSGITSYRIARWDLTNNNEKVFQSAPSNLGGLAVDGTTDYMFFSTDSGSNSTITSQRVDFTGAYSSVSQFSLNARDVLSNLLFVSKIEIDYNNNKIYFIHTADPESAIYRCNPDGTSLEAIVREYSPWQINSFAIDNRNQRISYVTSLLNTAAGYLGSTTHKCVSLDGLTNYGLNNIIRLPNLNLTAGAYDIDLDTINNNTYISLNEYTGSGDDHARIVKYTGLTSLGTASGTVVGSGDYLSIDARNNKIYYNLKDSTTYGQLRRTDLNGSAHTFLSSGIFTQLCLDGFNYKTFAEFDLTNPNTAIQLSDSQMYSDIYLNLRGKTVFPSGNITLSKDVVTGIQDGYWQLSGPTLITFDNTDSALKAQYSAPNTYGSFILFSGISLPQNKVITSASMRLYNEFTLGATPAAFKIRICDSGAAVTPTTFNQASGQPKSSPIFWDLKNTGLGYVTTPDLTTQVQSILNKSDWQTNNNLLFYIEPSGDTTTTQLAQFRSFNFGAPYIPQLNITYAEADTTTSGTIVSAKIIDNNNNILWRSTSSDPVQFKQSNGLTTLQLGSDLSEINSLYNTNTNWTNARLHLNFSFLNNIQNSGVFQLYSAEVNCSCSGSAPVGTPTSSGLTNYIFGYGSSSGNLPLFIAANQSSSGIRLFEKGYLPSSGLLTIYISGGSPNATLPLFIMVNSGAAITDSINLFSNGTSKSGVFDTLTLFTKILDYQENSGVIPLYIKGNGNFYGSSTIPIYLNAVYNTENDSINLFLQNTGFGSGIPLYIKGKGYGYDTENNYLASDGATPYFGSMPLFINRKDENKTLTMFLKNQQNSGTMPLYTIGNFSPSGFLTLFLMSESGTRTNSINTYTHGY